MALYSKKQSTQDSQQIQTAHLKHFTTSRAVNNMVLPVLAQPVTVEQRQATPVEVLHAGLPEVSNADSQKIFDFSLINTMSTTPDQQVGNNEKTNTDRFEDQVNLSPLRMSDASIQHAIKHSRAFAEKLFNCDDRSRDFYLSEVKRKTKLTFDSDWGEIPE